MNKPPQVIKGAAALLQAAILVFLQVYSIFPAFRDFVAPFRHGAVCCGDHRICGCPLEKIVNQTCCCFKSAEIAKSLMDHHKNTTMSKSDINRLARFVSPPCGDQPDLNPPSIEKIIFLRFAATHAGPDFLLALYPPISGDPVRTRSNEPPDPPPKSINCAT